MWWVARIIVGLVCLVLVLVVAAFFLPRNVVVARSILIDAPPAAIFPYVNGLKHTEEWSPWLERDPDVAVTYSGPDTGVGNRMEWHSDVDTVGSGTQEIVASEPESHVRTALDFGDMGTAFAEFDLEHRGEATQVTWTLETDTGFNPMMRWMGLMFDGWVGPDYEAGLRNLKDAVESQ